LRQGGVLGGGRGWEDGGETAVESRTSDKEQRKHVDSYTWRVGGEKKI